ncbi:MFS general substrate transporter [Xylariaceae sp. FL0594]|nr:MFS general substrate transporter [Xylariaceae sp. FL0594]
MPEFGSNVQAPLLGAGSNSSTSKNECGGSVPKIAYGSTISRDANPYFISRDSPCDMGGYGECDGDDEDGPDKQTQAGIRQADAINQVWSRATLITAYIFIFLSSLGNALQWQVIFNLMPYVVSEFGSHSLIPTIAVVSNILSGVLKLPVAKVIDSWGRPQGFASATLLAAAGLLSMSLCQEVRTYAAAHVIYSIGITGASYILDIIVADTSSLKNRSLAFAFSSFPCFISTLVGPCIASQFTDDGRWRWAFGASSVLLLVLYFPLFWILTLTTRKARRAGLLPRPSAHDLWTKQSIKKYLVEYDALGISLLSAGISLILVPFSLVGEFTAKASLRSYSPPVLLGVALTIAFVFHERKAKKPFIPFSLLCSRNVTGACLLSVTLFVSYFAWDGYYTSYLQVVHGLSVTKAGLIGQIYSLGSSIWGVVVGYMIHKSDRFKWLAVLALPIHILGGFLMITFRRPETDVVWVVMCQILLTIGGSTLVVCDQMAVMAVANHAELASIMAVLSLATYVGSAVGSSLSGAIWNSTLPGALAELLPGTNAIELGHIASDLKKQLSYPLGSPTRTAIIGAYGKSQARMCIVGSVISLLEIAAVLIWRDSRLSESKQVKGTVL